MGKTKKLLLNWRVILVLVFLVFAVITINYNPGVEGVAIRSVMVNSSAALAGVESPPPNSLPRTRERILSINNIPITNVADYFEAVENLEPNMTVQIKTNERFYRLTTKPLISLTQLNETEELVIEKVVEVNKTINGTIVTVEENVTSVVTVPKIERKVIGTEDLGFSVYDAPTTNLRKGLDLQGGTRVLLEPEEKLSEEDLDSLIDNMKYRLNVFGLSDVLVTDARDLSGNQYVLVELAGVNEGEVQDLLAKQGKFEAKIGEETVFIGGKDITYVCRSADCSGIDPNAGCSQFGSGWSCRFSFSISLTPEAAKKQSDLTANLAIIDSGTGTQYLSKNLSLYLDDELVDELSIGSDLRGRAVTEIQISGSGVGVNQEEATFAALENMKRLQTILITGSLPVKLTIAKTDNISPVLGDEFVQSALMAGFLAILVVTLFSWIRYRRLRVAIPMLVISVSEVVILLFVAALIGWNLDLAAIAGIIIAVGTSIDHQIVITDETIRGEGLSADWKKRIKNAFFIIMGAFFTTVAAMIPLVWAGAGLLKGFAFTTIIGVSIGVFLTRPAYAAIIEILLKE